MWIYSWLGLSQDQRSVWNKVFNHFDVFVHHRLVQPILNLIIFMIPTPFGNFLLKFQLWFSDLSLGKSLIFAWLFYSNSLDWSRRMSFIIFNNLVTTVIRRKSYNSVNPFVFGFFKLKQTCLIWWYNVLLFRIFALFNVNSIHFNFTGFFWWLMAISAWFFSYFIGLDYIKCDIWRLKIAFAWSIFLYLQSELEIRAWFTFKILRIFGKVCSLSARITFCSDFSVFIN